MTQNSDVFLEGSEGTNPFFKLKPNGLPSLSHHPVLTKKICLKVTSSYPISILPHQNETFGLQSKAKRKTTLNI